MPCDCSTRMRRLEREIRRLKVNSHPSRRLPRWPGYVALLTLAIVLLTGCAVRGPGAKRLPEKLGQPYQGVRAAAPDMPDGEKRLDIFLGVLPETEEPRLEDALEFERVIYCVALNPEKKPLPEVAKLIEATPADKLIFIYGEPITEKYGFWWDGVDCAAIAVGVWHTKARKYVYYDLIYGTPLLQWRFIRATLVRAVQKAADKATSAVVP